MRAAADDPVGLKLVGISADTITAIAFSISSALAAVAGIMVSYETNLEPTMGLSAVLKGITAAIVGGMVSIPGAFLGAYVVGFAENFGVIGISAGWKDTISFAVLILFLLLRPRGLITFAGANR
jgi:branched-chain amino acid transport system permease protein